MSSIEARIRLYRYLLANLKSNKSTLGVGEINETSESQINVYPAIRFLIDEFGADEECAELEWDSDALFEIEVWVKDATVPDQIVFGLAGQVQNHIRTAIESAPTISGLTLMKGKLRLTETSKLPMERKTKPDDYGVRFGAIVPVRFNITSGTG